MRKPALALSTAAALLASMALSMVLAQSGRLEPGDATLDSGEYIDVYERQLEAGDIVTISITSEEFDPYLVIVDPNDGVDFQVDDSPGAGLNVEAEYTAPMNGVFLIVVTSALAEETGSYILTIEETETTPTNPLASQQAGNPLAPAAAAGARLFEPRLAATPALPGVQPEPGYIKGVVFDRHGEPIPGATVAVYGTTIAGENTRFETTTAADGSYRRRVPDGIYGVSAYVKTSYAGDRFEIPLPAADGNNSIELDAADGGVENFVWFLEGLREAGLSPDDEYSYHGMSLTLSSATSFAAAPHLANGTVELLLTPTGPLIDGSEGRPLLYLHQLGSDAGSVGPTDGGYVDLDTEFLDIPLGSYTVTARLLTADGAVMPLRLSGWCCSPEDLEDSFALVPVPYDVVRSPVPFPTLYVAP